MSLIAQNVGNDRTSVYNLKIENQRQKPQTKNHSSPHFSITRAFHPATTTANFSIANTAGTKPETPTMKFRQHSLPLFPGCLIKRLNTCVYFARTCTNTRTLDRSERGVCSGPMKITSHGKFEFPLISLLIRVWHYWNKGSSRDRKSKQPDKYVTERRKRKKRRKAE